MNEQDNKKIPQIAEAINRQKERAEVLEKTFWELRSKLSTVLRTSAESDETPLKNTMQEEKVELANLIDDTTNRIDIIINLIKNTINICEL